MKRDDYVPTDLAEVHAAAAEGDAWTLVFVRNLDHPPAVVWAALTEPAQLDEWAPFRADRNLAETGPATLKMIDGAQLHDAYAERLGVTEQVVTSRPRDASAPDI